eukprot:scaffold40413_cov38-Tisochrysis_lutea.AAC.5
MVEKCEFSVRAFLSDVHLLPCDPPRPWWALLRREHINRHTSIQIVGALNAACNEPSVPDVQQDGTSEAQHSLPVCNAQSILNTHTACITAHAAARQHSHPGTFAAQSVDAATTKYWPGASAYHDCLRVETCE